MAYYTLDYSLIIPLLNKFDKNHSFVTNLLKKEKNDCFFCESTISNTQEQIRHKITYVVEKSLKKIKKIAEIDSKFERDSYLIKSFNKLIEEDKKTENFYKFLYEKIYDFLKGNPIEKLSNYLSELSLNMIRVIVPALREKITFLLIELNLEDGIVFEKYFQIHQAIKSIRFKNVILKDTFCELATHSRIEFIINCYTRVKDFSKEANKAISILEKDINFAPNVIKFTCVNTK